MKFKGRDATTPKMQIDRWWFASLELQYMPPTTSMSLKLSWCCLQLLFSVGFCSLASIQHEPASSPPGQTSSSFPSEMKTCRTNDCKSNSLTLPQKFRSVRSSCISLSNMGQICRTPFSSCSLSLPGFRGTRTTIPQCSRSCPGRRGKLSFPSSVTGTARFWHRPTMVFADTYCGPTLVGSMGPMEPLRNRIPLGTPMLHANPHLVRPIDVRPVRLVHFSAQAERI